MEELLKQRNSKAKKKIGGLLEELKKKLQGKRSLFQIL